MRTDAAVSRGEGCLRRPESRMGHNSAYRHTLRVSKQGYVVEPSIK